MEKPSIYEIAEKISKKSDLTSQDIPNLDLYMDQILTLFDEQLADNKRYPEDKLLTKTMINNYSKSGLIAPVKGKKYSKEQILQMLTVFHLKNTISIQEIKHILSPMYENNAVIEQIYNRCSTIKQQQNQEFPDLINDFMETHQLSLDNDVDRFITIMSLSTLTTQLTNTIEQVIDSYYINEKSKDID